MALLSATASAEQALSSSSDGTTITWLRGGTAPEIAFARFEQSFNGTTWSDITHLHPDAVVGRVGSSSDWLADGVELNEGVTLQIRVRGVVPATPGGSSGLVESILHVASPPQITNVLIATGTYGATFSFPITASNSPTDFDALNLPPGLSIDHVTGVISGTPQASGTFSVPIAASNNAGSGAAVITLTILPRDVTGQLQMSRSGFRLNRSTQRFVQTLTVQNTSHEPITGPVSIVFDQLSANSTLHLPTGLTSITPPIGNPYVNLNVGPDGVLSPGEIVTAILEFGNSSNQNITYTTQAFAGTGSR
jgi:hypothetical protein